MQGGNDAKTNIVANRTENGVMVNCQKGLSVTLKVNRESPAYTP